MIGHNYWTYITTNPKRTTLYVGMTNDLFRRLDEHFQNSGIPETFAGRYYCYNLIYFELHSDVNVAIAREKEIKKWNSINKEKLISEFNPKWKFLNDEV